MLPSFEWPYGEMKPASVEAIELANSVLLVRKLYDDQPDEEIGVTVRRVRVELYSRACEAGIVFW